jgi:hypothetical protein
MGIMAKALPDTERQQNGVPHQPAGAALTTESSGGDEQAIKGTPLPGDMPYWQPQPPSDPDLASVAAEGQAEPAPGAAVDPEEVEQLRRENAALQRAIARREQELQERLEQMEQAWAERQKEYEGLLEEKSEVIRELHLKVQEHQQHRPVAATPREEELLALSDELERERCQLEQERRQLQEDRGQLKADEEDLMKQMREMEVQMSRERAEIARQRNEIQRLHSEIRHELELATRDATLRERLLPLQRRHQEMVHRKGGQVSAREPATPEATTPAPAPAAGEPARKKDSGLIRRIFGQS